MTLKMVVKYCNKFPSDAKPAFGRAVDTWQKLLNSDTTVEIRAYWNVPLEKRLTAICVPNAVENFINTGLKNTWYTSALADKLAGGNVQKDEPDMVVSFNSKDHVYHTDVNNPPSNKLDLESVALHEMCHGLGFVGLFDVDLVGVGRYGYQGLLRKLPPKSREQSKLGFKLPELRSRPSVYGTFIADKNGDLLTEPSNYKNGSKPLGVALKSNDLHFVGKKIKYKVYAPKKFAPFTTIDHLLVTPSPSLMRPSIGLGKLVRTVDKPVLDILAEIGW